MDNDPVWITKLFAAFMLIMISAYV